MRYKLKKKFYLYLLALAIIPICLILLSADIKQEVLPVSYEIDIPLPKTAVIDAVPDISITEEITSEPEMEETKPMIESELADDPDFEPYNIPLSAELQQYTYDLCQERGLDFETVLALMYVESSYRPDVISDTNDYGIMQTNICNHSWLEDELEITDFLDAGQSINAGTFMLMNIAEKYPDTHQMLMVYNFGETGARKVWSKGIYSSKYSRRITAKADELRTKGTII